MGGTQNNLLLNKFNVTIFRLVRGYQVLELSLVLEVQELFRIEIIGI